MELRIAASNGDLLRVKQLLEEGVDVNTKNENGHTALFLASRFGYADIVQLLVDAGADVNAKTLRGGNPLCTAAYHGHVEVVRALLGAGADVNAENTGGLTALMLAAENGHVEVVRALLGAGADVNVKYNDGWTALKIAAYVWCSGGKTMRLLLEQGADPEPLHLKYLLIEERWDMLCLGAWKKRASMVALRNYLLNLDD